MKTTQPKAYHTQEFWDEVVRKFELAEKEKDLEGTIISIPPFLAKRTRGGFWFVSPLLLSKPRWELVSPYLSTQYESIWQAALNSK